jgi:hypothetical protein
VTGPGTIIQSDFPHDADHKNFEVVALEGNQLVHYWLDNGDATNAWQRGRTITRAATSAGCLISSDFPKNADHRNFEVVVLEGERLVHYWHDNSNPNVAWRKGGVDQGMYVYFTTDHYDIGRLRKADSGPIMGRTVLAKSNDNGNNFRQIYELSRTKFINVSVALVSGRDVPGLPNPNAETVLLWGSGRYRASDVYLACMPYREIDNLASLRYMAGLDADGSPRWSAAESDAVPLFAAGCVGEFSVRWNRFIDRWIMLYNADNPWAIVSRTAQLPWSGWDEDVRFIDIDTSKFAHRKPEDNHGVDDGLADDGKDDAGGLYGPYQIEPLTRGLEGESTELFWLASTWNPYQAVLLKTPYPFRPPSVPRFRLSVDPLAAMPFSDLTGRHALIVQPDAFGVVIANETAPDGSQAMRFTGGWLEITNLAPAAASDFVFESSGRTTLEFWFKSAEALAPEAVHRMHLLGFGDSQSNLDIDFGDTDATDATGAQTACWTYFASNGDRCVVEQDANRNAYLDNKWHHYRMVRDGNLVRVTIDDRSLGATTIDLPIGAVSGETVNSLGRASLMTRTHFAERPGYPEQFNFSGSV